MQGDSPALREAPQDMPALSVNALADPNDLAANVGALGRFRFNVYVQRGEVAMVARPQRQPGHRARA